MGRPEVESTDHLEGIAPVPKRVRLDPGRPGKIIAVPRLLKSNTPGPFNSFAQSGYPAQ